MRILLCVALLLSVMAAPVETSPPRKAQVMVLGVAHLVWRRDVHNAVFQDSPLSPKRQAQIAEIVDRLARFHPTKVLIEEPMGDPKVLRQYREFLAGKFTLPADEAHQFGFKLAARSDNPAIYPVDTFGPSLIDYSSAKGKRIDQFLEKHAANVDDAAFNAYLARTNELERNGTYLDLLRYLNTDEAIRANASVYSIIAGMGRDVDDAGTAWVAQWYSRNVYIFSNILSVIKPGDRVVVMFGQGHEYLLRGLTRLDPNLTYVDPITYLSH